MIIREIDLLDPSAEEQIRDASLVIAEDTSSSEAEHEEAILNLRRLSGGLPVPFFSRGNIRTLEDVKKYIYAGSRKVILSPEQTELAEQGQKRFGAERVVTDLSSLKEPEAAFSFEDFRTDEHGLVPVIVQDDRSLQVLMLAYMNREAFEKTLQTGRMTYYSRSRQQLWTKGETSGHFQIVRSLFLDCDNDTILARAAQIGPACHTGNTSCFYRPILEDPYPQMAPAEVIDHVYGIITDRRLHPKEGSYTNYLFDKGVDKICKKIGEEATEVVIAAKNPEAAEIKYEISDLLYHLMVLMVDKGVTWKEVAEELARR